MLEFAPNFNPEDQESNSGTKRQFEQPIQDPGEANENLELHQAEELAIHVAREDLDEAYQNGIKERSLGGTENKELPSKSLEARIIENAQGKRIEQLILTERATGKTVDLMNFLPKGWNVFRIDKILSLEKIDRKTLPRSTDGQINFIRKVAEPIREQKKAWGRSGSATSHPIDGVILWDQQPQNDDSTLVLLHEMGHALQSKEKQFWWKSIVDSYNPKGPVWSERNAWAHALNLLREIRQQGVDPLPNWDVDKISHFVMESLHGSNKIAPWGYDYKADKRGINHNVYQAYKEYRRGEWSRGWPVAVAMDEGLLFDKVEEAYKKESRREYPYTHGRAPDPFDPEEEPEESIMEWKIESRDS